VAPAAHNFEGGIAINGKGDTGVPGLYLAGECGGGMFGANRVCDATTEMVEGVERLDSVYEEVISVYARLHGFLCYCPDIVRGHCHGYRGDWFVWSISFSSE